MKNPFPQIRSGRLPKKSITLTVFLILTSNRVLVSNLPPGGFTGNEKSWVTLRDKNKDTADSPSD